MLFYFLSSFGSLATTLRFPKRKSASRICARLRERFAQRDAYHGLHRRQSFLVSLVFYNEWSWSALKQFWCKFRILIYGRMICQWLIHIKEIGPTSFESPYHVRARDVMSALLYAINNPTKRKLRRSKTNVDYFDQVALGPPIFDPLGSSAGRSMCSQKQTLPSPRPNDLAPGALDDRRPRRRVQGAMAKCRQQLDQHSRNG